MKTYLFSIKFVVTLLLFFADIAWLQTAQSQIVIDYIPPVGEGGIAEGRVVWDELTAENAGQYAVIAILQATWPGGGDDYVKPDYSNYLNPVDASGNFFINITTNENDKTFPNFIFYLVLKETFNEIEGQDVKSWTMAGKYIGVPAAVNRNTFWADLPGLPQSNVHPGFVAPGTSITLSCRESETIRYTLDGSDPVTSSTAQVYSNDVFVVTSESPLIVKAVTEKSGAYSYPASMLWMPYESYSTPLFGVNVSLALKGEPFGYSLPEAETEARMVPVASIAKWIRTFGTINNGHPYINKIAKSKGLRTLIGLYITGNSSDNSAQLQGLRQILQLGPAPDLIAVGNETTLAGLSPAILAESIDSVRAILKEFNLLHLPVGSVDIGGAAWSRLVLNKLDFVGVNLYPGTWDDVLESNMINELKQRYINELTSFNSKCVLITETGTPYAGTPYKPAGFDYTQTPSTVKAAAYLKDASDWFREDSIPGFYFELYDEPVKSQNGGHQIEQYFGLMDGNLHIHSFYEDVLGKQVAISQINSSESEVKIYPNPTKDMVFLETASDINVYDMQGILLQKTFGREIDLSTYNSGIYLMKINGVLHKLVKQ
jgi:exo-beta-1,3-glucanase (GH17 family)